MLKENVTKDEEMIKILIGTMYIGEIFGSEETPYTEFSEAIVPHSELSLTLGFILMFVINLEFRDFIFYYP